MNDGMCGRSEEAQCLDPWEESTRIGRLAWGGESLGAPVQRSEVLNYLEEGTGVVVSRRIIDVPRSNLDPDNFLSRQAPPRMRILIREPGSTTRQLEGSLPTLVSIDRAVIYGRLLRYVSNIQMLCVLDMLTSLLWLFIYQYRFIALHGILPLLGIVGARLRNRKLLLAFSFYLTAAVALHLGFAISYNIWPLAFWIATYIYLMYLTYKLLRLLRELTPLELATVREAHVTLRRVRNGR